ncbi:hypothetical protein [Parasphingopyxis marina]|uniref:Uncharacterized protein n=1 Tax=Parasphingopyxis marina TaxID=2761622 RepID=A0A842I009_9SPHN|nr:hypothetical protein [Parasphingopyxis marina]MBC2777094.1 hypothetical protein [Parasphingopyxis marina]
MNNEMGFHQRVLAIVAAAAVSSMCVLGTIGPVQAGPNGAPMQVAANATPAGQAHGDIA